MILPQFCVSNPLTLLSSPEIKTASEFAKVILPVTLTDVLIPASTIIIIGWSNSIFTVLSVSSSYPNYIISILVLTMWSVLLPASSMNKDIPFSGINVPLSKLIIIIVFLLKLL